MNQFMSRVVLAAIAVSAMSVPAVARQSRASGEILRAVTFKFKAYRVNAEKGFALVSNFARLIRKHDRAAIVDKSMFESAIEKANENHTIQLVSSPVLKSLLGMPCFVTVGNDAERYSVRGLAEMVKGEMSIRVMASSKPFNTEDKTNPFWSDAEDGPINLKIGQGIAIYNPGEAGKPGTLTTVEVLVGAQPTSKL